jgi:hypothetical protein
VLSAIIAATTTWGANRETMDTLPELRDQQTDLNPQPDTAGLHFALESRILQQDQPWGCIKTPFSLGDCIMQAFAGVVRGSWD